MAEHGPIPISCWRTSRPRRPGRGAAGCAFFSARRAGVGKTYAMLEAARGARTSGTDLVLGYVEPHGRIETERLMEGLEQLPTLP